MYKFNLLQISRGLGTRLLSSYRHIEISNLTNDIYSIEMQKLPVNTLSLEFMQEITDAIQELEKKKTCRAVVFTSKLKVFSAGFDIHEMWKPDLKRLERFLGTAQQLALTIMKTNLVTAAAINGSCIAGGCVLAFLSDITVMNNSDNLKIGLSATRMGITPPALLLLPMKNLIGHRQTEMLASQSIMLNPSKAAELGLIQTVVEKEEVIPLVIKLTESYLDIPEIGRIKTKQHFNHAILKELDCKERLRQETKHFTTQLISPEIQELMEIHLENIKRK